MNKKVKIEKVREAFVDLEDFDFLAKEHSYLSIIEWSNGEGFTIDLNGEQLMMLTYGQMKAIKKILKKLKNENSNN